jgi:hypothetical protein
MNALGKTYWAMRATLVLVTILSQISVWSHSLRAGITSIIDPFSGDMVETWEEFPVANPGSPVMIFGGQATISGDNPFVWMTTYSLGTPGGLGLGPFPARASDGTHGYVTSVSPGAARITFQLPVTDFGGYWGYAVEYPAAIFNFYDSQGLLIGSENFNYSSPNNDGTLQWQGWHSTVPIASVSYSGHWVANDSLRIALVPEPRVNLILALAVTAVGIRQILRRNGKNAA